MSLWDHHRTSPKPCRNHQCGRSEYRTYTPRATRAIPYKPSYFPTYVIPAALVLPFSCAHICLVGTTGVRVLRERGGSFDAFISLASSGTVFSTSPRFRGGGRLCCWGPWPVVCVGGLGFVALALTVVVALPVLRSYLSSGSRRSHSLIVDAVGRVDRSDGRFCFALSGKGAVFPDGSRT